MKNWVIAVYLIIGFGWGTARGQHTPPNIILILADDLGYADLSLHGSKQVKTPNIDALAKRGAQFTQGYVTAPVCSPSRAGLLTGKNQVSFGYDNNLAENQPGFDSTFAGLPIQEKTIGDYLKSAGYVTGLMGKWHLGHQPQFHPVRRGFDEFWGYLGGGHDYFKELPHGKGYMAPLVSNFKKPDPITYLTDDTGNECIDFIRRHKNHPYFLYASFNAPHAPIQALEEDLALFKHIPDVTRRTYLAMIHRFDLNVGRLMKAVEASGQADNTLIFFLSDNGGPVDQNGSLNAPLNGQKGILMEGGLRVPFFVSWPKKIAKNLVIDRPVSALDIVPTCLAAANSNDLSLAWAGKDLVTSLKNPAAPTELTWRFTISAAIRWEQWKLIRLPDRLPLLFNLQNDPSETTDVAMQYPDITQKLLKKLGSWDLALPHPVFLEGAEWKQKQRDLYDKTYQLTQPN